MEEKDYIRNRDKHGLLNWFDQLVDEKGEPLAILRLRIALVGESFGDSEVSRWYQENVQNEINDRLQNFINYSAIRILCNQGQPPNSGYQIDPIYNNLFNLNELHSDIISGFVPPDIRNYICENDLYFESENPFEEIEKDLGVPFFKNLATIIKLRIRFLSYTMIGTYLEEIIQGVSSRLGIDITDKLMESLPQEIFVKAVEGGFTDLKFPVHAIDILSALGEAQECVPDANNNIYITERGNNQLLRVFNPLWKGNVLLQAGFPENLV